MASSNESTLNSFESLLAGLATLVRVEAGVSPVHFPRSSTLQARAGRRRPLRGDRNSAVVLSASSKLVERMGCWRRFFLAVLNGCRVSNNVLWRGVIGNEKCPKCSRDCDGESLSSSFNSRRRSMLWSSSSSSSPPSFLLSDNEAQGGGVCDFALSTLSSASRVSSLVVESKSLKESCHNMVKRRWERFELFRFVSPCTPRRGGP